MSFIEQANKELELARINVNHLIWQLGFEALTGAKIEKRYTLDQFKELKYHDCANIYDTNFGVIPFPEYWKKIIMNEN